MWVIFNFLKKIVKNILLGLCYALKYYNARRHQSTVSGDKRQGGMWREFLSAVHRNPEWHSVFCELSY
jgi:hypothetical protein